MRLLTVLVTLPGVVLVSLAWRSLHRKRIYPTWRHWLSQFSLVLISASLAAFFYHLLTALFDWGYLPRGPFDDFVEISFLAAGLSVFTGAFAKGFVRCTSLIVGSAVAYLWLLVAAWSWI